MVLAILGVVIAMVIPAISQDMPADNMKFVYEKIRADKKLFIAENIQLTEAEAKDFWPVHDRYQDELFLLRTRTLKMIQEYADAIGMMTNDTAKNLLEEYMTIETLGLKLRQAYLPRFRKPQHVGILMKKAREVCLSEFKSKSNNK